MTSISGLPGTRTRPIYDSTDSLLRFAMRADATLTGLMGFVVAVAAERSVMGLRHLLPAVGIASAMRLPTPSSSHWRT